jgi:hypothetical protein
MLAVFLLSGVMATTSANQDLTGIGSCIFNYTTIEETHKLFSGLIGAIATFEGTLQAYSVSENPNVEVQVFLASNEISSSLDALNSELADVYKDLSKEQQLAVEDAYLSLGSYLEKLAEEANQIFQDEDGKAKAQFEVQEVDIIFENLPNQLWVGSVISV